MKFTLIIVLFTTISFSASAQWWKLSHKHEARVTIAQVSDNYALKHLPVYNISAVKIPSLALKPSDYSLEIAEASVMKIAQHNMRFRIYDIASYNFSDLAKLYIQQNRLSEAKWYLLQSNNISRQENDDKHTIDNLMALALIKANMGDVVLAQQDLTEARQLALVKSWAANITAIDKEVKYIQQNRTSASKTELRYADAAIATKKAD